MSVSYAFRFSAVLGNILDHYDTALFGFLAPFLAPLFFPSSDPTVSLILAYCILPIGIFTRPIGSIVFGKIGDTLGRQKVLSISLIGVAISTVLIGFLPTYSQIGILAPFLLAILRAFQSFFAVGESTGGIIYVLEETQKEKRSLINSLYDGSTIIGSLCASCLVMLFSQMDIVETKWRILFWIGGLTAVFGFFLRVKNKEPLENRPHNPYPKFWELFRSNHRILFTLIITSGFTYMTYAYAFTLMNGFIPLVTSISKCAIMRLNTSFLILDLALLPCFGFLAMHYGKTKMMKFGLIGLIFTIIPLFSCLYLNSMVYVILLRFFIVFFGVSFAASYYSWALDITPKEIRFTLLSFSYAIGSQLIGNTSPTISLWLYKTTHLPIAPALYLAAIASLALFAITKTSEKTSKALYAY